MPTTLKKLYTQYPHVSAQTKTDIINAIGFDVESSTISEGGIYTKEQLAQGLRYLLSKNHKLSPYMETEVRHDSAAYHDPFYVPNGSDWLLISMMMNSHHHHHGGAICTPHCDCGKGSSDAAAAAACVSLSLATAGFCICSGVNTFDTIKNKEESNAVKSGKIIIYLLAALISETLLTYFLHDKPKHGFGLDDDTAEAIATFTFRYVLPLMVAAATYALVSYIGKQIAIPKKPSADLLAELDVVRQLLEKNYMRKGDNPEECKAFTKDVVRYYIDAMSNKNMMANTIATETTHLIPPPVSVMTPVQPSAPPMSSSPHSFHYKSPPPVNSPLPDDDLKKYNQYGYK